MESIELFKIWSNIFTAVFTSEVHGRSQIDGVIKETNNIFDIGMEKIKNIPNNYESKK